MTEDAAQCLICGRPITAGDVLAEVRYGPGYVPPPMHRDCWAMHLERSHARQRAWSRSLRGRISLALVWLKLTSIVVAGVLLSLVAAGPAAVWHGLRGWYLRRAIRKRLGVNRGLMLVKSRQRADAERLAALFPTAWAASQRIVVHVVDPGDASARTLEDAAWRHWRPRAKLPVAAGIVFVPLTGSVRQWSLDARGSSDARGGTSDDRTIGVRTEIDVLLGR